MKREYDYFTAAFFFLSVSLGIFRRIIWNATEKVLTRLLYAVFRTPNWLVHHPWAIVAILVVVIAIQQVKIINLSVSANSTSHRMWEMQCQLDSACMTNYKLSKY